LHISIFRFIRPSGNVTAVAVLGNVTAVAVLGNVTAVAVLGNVTAVAVLGNQAHSIRMSADFSQRPTFSANATEKKSKHDLSFI
jgi:hypothetical protein